VGEGEPVLGQRDPPAVGAGQQHPEPGRDEHGHDDVPPLRGPEVDHADHQSGEHEAGRLDQQHLHTDPPVTGPPAQLRGSGEDNPQPVANEQEVRDVTGDLAYAQHRPLGIEVGTRPD
jgi:hypothetical protein